MRFIRLQFPNMGSTVQQVSFNSLYEIPRRLLLGESLLGVIAFNSLYEILKHKTKMMKGSIGRTFNSLYEIHLEHEHVYESVKDTFNSLYEILFASWGDTWRPITFNSLYEIRGMLMAFSVILSVLLSILFMRFLYPIIWLRQCLRFFQFSLWDSQQWSY